MASNELLTVIKGEQLSAVTFVQDYVQLHFDGPVLTAFTAPVVTAGNTALRWGEPGYRDMLCGRIAHIVRDAFVEEGDQIRVEFDDDSVISISLRYEDFAEGQAEAATFADDLRKRWEVWN
jgi:hypothetical protein